MLLSDFFFRRGGGCTQANNRPLLYVMVPLFVALSKETVVMFVPKVVLWNLALLTC